MFEFSWPFAFLLLPLPLLMRYLKAQQKTPITLNIAGFAKGNAPASAEGITKKPSFLIWLVWVMLCTSAANPIHYGEPITLPDEGRDIMLAVDLSGSMDEADMAYQGQYIDRLSLVKAVVSEFISDRKGDRLGLILFGDTAFLQTPLTRDVNTVRKMLEEAQMGLVGKSTAIGDALGLAVKRFELKKDSNRILILLTDGQNTSGNIEPKDALLLAREEGIKVYTVGVGSEGRRQGLFSFGFSSGNSLDETLLKEIAQQTGGQYFRATDAQTLQQIYQELDELEPREDKGQTFRPQQAWFYLPLGVAWLVVIVSLLIRVFNQFNLKGQSNDA